MKLKKKILFFRNIGIALSVLQFIISVIFCWQLFELNWLSEISNIGITVILILLCVITLLLQSRYKAGIFGKILSVILIVALVFGSVLIGDVSGTLRSLTQNANVQKENICVYIMADREIPTDAEAAEYNYGILASSHGDSLDNMINILTEKFGTEPMTAEYKTAEDLAEALYNDKVEAIILSDSFIPVITDTEAYANFETYTKVLYSEEFSISIDSGNKELDSDVMMIYLSGIDRYGSVEGVSRSDVNIAAVVNIKTKEILLINTPRDYFVNLKFDNGNYSSSPDKLTHAGLYGINVSMNTLESIYEELDFDYYFRVNFTGFEQIIDALGGIDIYIPKSFVGTVYGTRFTKGEAHLNGQEALDFVRERHAFADGDNQRGRDQMEVIAAIIDKISSPAVVSGYSEILESLQRYFQTDIPTSVISSLVRMQLADGAEWNITMASVEGEGSYRVPYSMSTTQWVMMRNESDEEEVNELIRKVVNGESLKEEENDGE